MIEWWAEEIMNAEAEGMADAKKGLCNIPYPGTNCPTDEAINVAYKRGFDRQREIMGEDFKWA